MITRFHGARFSIFGFSPTQFLMTPLAHVMMRVLFEMRPALASISASTNFAKVSTPHERTCAFTAEPKCHLLHGHQAPQTLFWHVTEAPLIHHAAAHLS
tara:strand:- start:243 stop:539 length:297 start_codon:yes stop_codon:yes gene_type:complete